MTFHAGALSHASENHPISFDNSVPFRLHFFCAAAQVAAHDGINIGVSRIAIVGQEPDGRHHLPRLAVATLYVELDPRVLDGLQPLLRARPQWLSPLCRRQTRWETDKSAPAVRRHDWESPEKRHVRVCIEVVRRPVDRQVHQVKASVFRIAKLIGLVFRRHPLRPAAPKTRSANRHRTPGA
jgi:hypothetical protein